MDGKGNEERKWKEEEGRGYLCDVKAARGGAEARCPIGGAPNPGGQTPASHAENRPPWAISRPKMG